MYEDVVKALNEDEMNQKKLVYKYPEHDLEETKVMPNLSRLEKTYFGILEYCLQRQIEWKSMIT